MEKVLVGLQAVEEQIRRGLRTLKKGQGGGEGGSHKVNSETGSDHGCRYFYISRALKDDLNLKSYLRRPRHLLPEAMKVKRLRKVHQNLFNLSQEELHCDDFLR
ncbi:Hypothetical protein FKW44_005533 [Caligus rogercresseyi]|uniref:Uncharacterized protein n=1 Tax=Caligus rogercresseyi TaxID=217165 RepID=A0A7T8QS50_CALRO|nr:Hypothetical protein FKW44_005533 [Caligus rogercresseyi]